MMVMMERSDHYDGDDGEELIIMMERSERSDHYEGDYGEE
jgi:hypothetical protein